MELGCVEEGRRVTKCLSWGVGVVVVGDKCVGRYFSPVFSLSERERERERKPRESELM